MTDGLIIIKFGGSIITDKNSPTPELRKDILTNLIEQLAEIYNTKTRKIILVHGAGSFAHPIAKKYELKKGAHTKEQILATADINTSMMKLNTIVTEMLVAQGVPAVGLPPHAFITQNNGLLESIPLKKIDKYLDLEMIPVLYGDMVLDEGINASVLSGDAIVPYLGNKLRANRVIYVSDVDGIYTENPKINPNAELITLVNNENFESIIAGFEQHNQLDVTGEMKYKLLEIKSALPGIQVQMLNGSKPKHLLAAVDSQNVGTTLQFD